MRSTHSPPSYVDVVLVVLGAPLLLLVGVPALGYAIGAASWIILRGVGVAVDRHARAGAHVLQQLSLRIAFRLVRVLALVAAAVLAARAGRADGLAALLAITLAFTVQLISLLCAGPRRCDLPTSTSGATAGLGRAPSSLHQVLPCGDVQPVARRLAADGSSSWSAATEADTSCAATSPWSNT
jgi:hypothetical protein